MQPAERTFLIAPQDIWELGGVSGISISPLAFLPLQTNSLSRKCELWRNFSNIFHSENVFSPPLSLPSVSGSALVKRLSYILFVTANLWKCPPAAAAAYFSLPCIKFKAGRVAALCPLMCLAPLRHQITQLSSMTIMCRPQFECL